MKRIAALLTIVWLMGAASAFADDIQFPKTKYVTQKDGKDKEIKANLIFADGSVIVKDRKKPAMFATIPYEDIESVVYERSSHARTKTAILISPLALFSNGKKHWLTITYKNGEDSSFILLKLDKKEYKRILATVKTETGQDVERILDN